MKSFGKETLYISGICQTCTEIRNTYTKYACKISPKLKHQSGPGCQQSSTFLTTQLLCRVIAKQVLGCLWPPLISLLWRKQPTTGGKTIWKAGDYFDTVWPPTHTHTHPLKNPGYTLVLLVMMLLFFSSKNGRPKLLLLIQKPNLLVIFVESRLGLGLDQGFILPSLW